MDVLFPRFVQGRMLARARLKRAMNSAISTSPMMSGGASRMVLGFGALTMRPSRSAAATTRAATGCPSATPMQEALPRMPVISGESIAAMTSRSCCSAARGVLDESGRLDLGEHGVGGGRRERVAAEGAAVLAGIEQLGRVAEGDERADREAAADALGERDRVRGHVGVLEGEPAARATGAGLDLVDDEQRAVLAR